MYIVKQHTKDIEKINDLLLQAGIVNNKFNSLEDFMNKSINHIKKGNDAYYDGDEQLCEKSIDNAIKVLQLAKEYNKLVGL